MNNQGKNSAGSKQKGSEFGMRGVDSPEEAAFEAAVVQRLERLPEGNVPASFAARVTRLAVVQPVAARSVWAGFGPRIAVGSSVLLLILLFVVAAHANPSFLNLRFDVEMLLLVELGAVGFLVPHLSSRE
ncbi:MAG: hypothetical protein ACRYFU_16635 [Janthinobacterium lividum]